MQYLLGDAKYEMLQCELMRVDNGVKIPFLDIQLQSRCLRTEGHLAIRTSMRDTVAIDALRETTITAH